MPLKIIGAGFGRTGTNSLKIALEQLGFGPCYHMYELKNNPNHYQLWFETVSQGRRDWELMFQNYASAVDWPVAHFWRELAEVYPEAKIILTVRDPEDWYRSISSTILKVINTPLDPDPQPHLRLHRPMVRQMISAETFHFRYDEPEYVMAVFKKHIENVKKTIPPAKLLVYDVREGWEPLCKFLNAPIPPAVFPNTNSTRQFLGEDKENETPK